MKFPQLLVALQTAMWSGFALAEAKVSKYPAPQRRFLQSFAECTGNEALGSCNAPIDFAATATNPEFPQSALCAVTTSGPRADFIRFIQTNFLPVVNLLANFRCDAPGLVTAGGEGCVSPCETMQELVDVVKQPCEKVSELEEVLDSLKELDTALEQAKRMPFVKNVARRIEPALDPFIDRIEGVVNAGNKRCEEIQEKADNLFGELRGNLTEAHENIVLFNTLATARVDEMCMVENFFGGTTDSASRLRTRSLRKLRSLEGLTKIEGQGRRFLALQEEAIDFSPLIQAQQIMVPILDLLNEFAARVKCLTGLVDTALGGAIQFFDDLSVFINVMNSLQPFSNAIVRIVDALSFLQCPRFLGFICNLDSLIIGIVEKILRAAGIDIEEIIRDVVEAVLEKIGFPDADDLLAVLPELNFLGDIDLAAEVFDELKAKVADIFDQVTIDPSEEAFDTSGNVDVEFDGVPLEFRRAKGTVDTIQLTCPNEGERTIPLALVAKVTDSCGRKDLSGQIEVPCQTLSNGICNVDLKPFLPTRCQKDAVRSRQGYGFRPGLVDESSVLYVCIRPEDLGKIQAMPAPNQLRISGTTTRADKDLVCAEGARVLPLSYNLILSGSQRSDCTAGTGTSVTALRSQFARNCGPDSSTCTTFNTAGDQCAKVDFHRKTRRLKVSSCKTSGRVDFFTVGSVQFMCLQPFRDFVDDESSNLRIDFHMAAQSRAIKRYPACSCRKVRNLDCTGTARVSSIQEVEIPTNLQRFQMSCPSGSEIRIVQVLGSNIQGSTFQETGQTNETATYQAACDGKSSCVRSERSSIGFRLFRSTYECTCSLGFVRDQDSGECVPCNAGTFREEEMDTCEYCPEGTFSKEGSARCTACDPGFFADVEGSAECAACPAGTFGTEEESSTVDDCGLCPRNTFSEEGSDQCEDCPSGHISDIGSETCTAAEPGQFVNSNGDLENCPPGTFSSEEAATSCELCPAGSYSRIPGETQCILCQWGTFAGSTGSTSCELCPEGTYHSEIGQTSSGTCVVVENIDYTSPEFAGLTCEELLVLGWGSDDPESVAVLIGQVGNGICNRGPWNTQNCGYDGGDCCRETCTPLTGYGDNQYESELACTWTTYECIDPANNNDFTEVFDPRVVGRWWADNEEICPSAEGRNTGVAGDGVCDPVLNTAEFNFDGGDCCVETCNPNNSFPESCLTDCYCVQ